MAANEVGLPPGFQLDAAPAAAPAAVPGVPEGFTLDQPSVAADVAKSGGIGLVKGTLGVVGMGGDTRELGGTIASKVAGYLGASPEHQEMARKAANVAGYLSPLPAFKTSADMQKDIEGVTGQFHEPQTTAGHYAQTVGEFIPAAIGGEGSVIPRIIKQAVIPALASETAGQLTAGTAAEPYVRALAAGGSGVAADRIAASRAASAATRAATPTIDQTLASSKAGFQSPEVAAVTFKPNTIEDVSNIVASDLKRLRMNDRLAPQTHAILDDVKTPVNGVAHTIEDVQTSRQLLSDLAGNFANPTEQKAATQAIKTLDKLMESMPQSRVATGDIAKANDILTKARGDYASAMTAQRVAEKIRNADLRASSTYSGGNLNNATRQNLRTLLTSKKGQRGLTSDELQTIEDTVRGSTLGNVARAAGKLLGGGGGLGMLAGGAAGHALAGPLGLATPLVGYGVKKIGDAITRANANKITNQILARSPLGLQRAAAQPSIAPAQQLNLLKALLLSNAATLPTRMPSAQAQP